MHGWFDVTFEPMEFLAGNRSMQRRTFRLTQHVMWRDELVPILYVSRDSAGEWQLTGSKLLEQRACFSDPDGQLAAYQSSENPDEWAIESSSDGSTCLWEYVQDVD